MKRLVRAGSPEIVKIAGDSSPSSAETSFRELDDAFLQTQTRIWLGEVLHIRFDEETTIADLLADGELLFQVSKKVWKMLLKKHVELKHSKMYIYERTSSGKSDGRYMPYPKVDSFLKICRILGLTGIDLFSPSDVVEKRDARRVCMCIRSFSKKARCKNLIVPDFDIVTYTIAMPTDLVGGIRRNLEQSQYSSSSSNGCTSPSTDLKELYRQKRHGGHNFLYCDSHSESDEAESESAFTELEFQSPLSNDSYDGTNFSNIIGQHSPDGNLVVIGDLSESQTQFRLDTLEEVENVDKRSIQNGSHELEDALHSNSSLFHTERQMGVEEVMSPLRNPGNVVEINNADISAYQNFASKYGYSLHDLDEPHTVKAKEDFELFGPTLRRKSLEIDLSIYSFTDSVVTYDHPKEECVKTPGDSSTEDETVSCRLVDDGVRSEYMKSSKKNNILEFQDIVKEKTPPTENEVNGVGKKEESGNNTFQMDPCNSGDDTSDLIVNSIDDGNDGETRAKGPSLSMESLDLGQKEMLNGLQKKEVDEIEVTKVCSTSSLVSSKDEYAGNHFTSNGLDLRDSKIDISQSDSASAVDSEVEDMNEVSNSVADGNHSRRVETGCFDTDPTVHAGGENQDMVSNRTLSSYNPLLDKDCHRSCCSDSGSLEDVQVSQSQFDSLSGSSFSFNCNPTLSDCSPNESKISCNEDGYALKYDVDVEINSDERVHNPVMPIMDEHMIGNDQPVGESKICKSTTFDVSEVQLMDSHTERAQEVKVSREKNASYLTYDMYENPPVEVQENNTEKVSTEDSSCLDDLSIPITIDIYSIKENGEANGDERRKQEPEECNEDLMPKLDSKKKAEARAVGSKVLKSVVGTLTLLGAIFVVHHISRQKRTKDENTEFITPQQNQKPNQEFPAQKRVEIIKPDVVPAEKRYSGERLKF